MGLLYDYHVMLILGFVKVARGYVKKAGHILAVMVLANCNFYKQKIVKVL